MANPDQLQRFLFSETPIRGELVSLNQSYQDLVTPHHYPQPVAKLLGELAVCAALLSATLKFEGSLTLQIVSEGKISALMAECNSKQQIRGIARLSEQSTAADWIQKGTLAITIEPEKGQRYQGIVAVEGERIVEAVESYFAQSEQIKTRICLAVGEELVSGLLMQSLPQSSNESELHLDSDDWNTASVLLETLKDQELLELDNETILHRLFNQFEVRLFDSEPLAFHCRCSDDASDYAIQSLGKEDAFALLEERSGSIEIICEFCNKTRNYDAQSLATLFDVQTH